MTIKVDISSKLDKFQAEFAFESDSDRIGILGESGAGKSLLLKFLAGIYNPDNGEIFLDGKCLYSTDKKINVKPQDRNIAYMFQNYALFPTMSVRNNIEIVAKGSKEEKKKKADRLLKKFHIEELSERKPGELSGGQQQRVALARVLAYEPSVILLDEPFSALDQGLKEILQLEVDDMLKDFRGRVIMVSHSMDELYKFSDELIVVNKGGIVEMGKKEKLFHNPKTIRAARLLGVNNILTVKNIDKNVLRIEDWNISINVSEDVIEKNIEDKNLNLIEYIGIRDDGFYPVWEESAGDNIIDIEILNTYETMNQVKIFFNVAGCSDAKNKYTFVLDRKSYELNGLPGQLEIDSDKLIFLNS